MAGQGKEGKEKKNKDDVAAVVRRLADEVAALRAEVAAVRNGPDGKALAKGAASFTASTLADLLDGWDEETCRAHLTAAEDAAVARLGYALSSPPKIALVRCLQTGLTTGSLYHHLRELIHAEVVSSANRTRYALTPRGRRAVLLLFALVGEA
jgi:hypothetical protein